jgi:quercetin dioxygenase-like cupin family protein
MARIILTLGLGLVALCASLCAPAQEAPGRKELRRTELSGAPGMIVVDSIAEYPPGQALPRHVHHGVESVYVIQGAMIQLPGKEPTLLATGTELTNLRDAPHAGFTVVGDTPLRLFTVHIVDKDKPLYDTPK